MNTVAKKSACIVAIILAFCLMVAGIYLIIRSSVVDNNTNPLEVSAETGHVGGKDKNIDRDKETQDDKLKTETNTDSEGLIENPVKILNGKSSFTKYYTGDVVELENGIDFEVAQADGIKITYTQQPKGSAKNDPYIPVTPKEKGTYRVVIEIPQQGIYKAFKHYYDYNIVAEPRPREEILSFVITSKHNNDGFIKTYTGEAVEITKDDIKIIDADKNVRDDLEEKVVFSYRKVGSSTFTSEAPTKAGKYVVKMEIQGTEFPCIDTRYLIIEKASE
ncbi:MAG: hypothetical protein IJ837_02300 [Clostridia bacterium]|nr:hypothetical protein [Clostridia bacterium]